MIMIARGGVSLEVLVALAACLLLANHETAAATSIDTVLVGNAGNAADTNGRGAVAYGYRIGTTEVTNAQYAAFLNAKAASDPLELYNAGMGSGLGGIVRNGTPGNFSYATIAGRENKPVSLVGWYDAVRFANWLHNGQGSGDTETGAYTLLGGTPTPTDGNSITRNPGAQWWLPDENEWYKAAYYNGASATYYDYPTGSDTAPVAEAPPGGANSANFLFAVGDMTDAGAYVDSASPYGTFDQGGNLLEWTETLTSSSLRRQRGGSFGSSAGHISANLAFAATAFSEGEVWGFRVATVPEPSSIALAMMALGGLLLWRFAAR